MNVLIVYAHPEPKSFNASLKDLAVAVLTEKGHDVQVSDLYAMKWKAAHDREDFEQLENPDFLRIQPEERHASEKGLYTPDVKAEQEKLRWADTILFQAPLWWFSVPAIMKGWMDRVLTFGFAYGPGQSHDSGLLKGKRSMLSLTTAGPQPAYTPRGRQGDLNVILWPLHHGVLHFVGFDVLPPFVAWGASWATPERRREYLEQFKQRLLELETTEPIWFHLNSEFEKHQLKPGVTGKTPGQHG